MEQKVTDMRKNYRLEKDHSKTPIKELNKERVKREAANARRRVQDFIDRNNYAQTQKELHLEKLKREFGAALIEAIQQPEFQSSKQSEVLLKESEKYKDKDLWERQKVFMDGRQEKLKNLKKEMEDQDAIEAIRFQKETNKKALNYRQATPGHIDQSAKTAQTANSSHIKTTGRPETDITLHIDTMMIDGYDGVDEMVFKFIGESTPEAKLHSRDHSDYRLTPEHRHNIEKSGEIDD